MKISYSRLSTEVLCCLRGRYSQAWLSRRLGYRFNKVYRWESGQDIFYWNDFVSVCELLKVPLWSVCEKLSRLQTTKEVVLAEILERVFSRIDVKEASQQLKVSRHKIRRWLNGESRLPFYMFLEIIDLSSTMLLAFTQALLPKRSLKELAPRVAAERIAENLALDSPYFEAIVRAFQIVDEGDEHVFKRIESLTGIDARTVEHIAERLEKLGILSKHGGRVQVVHTRVVFTTQKIAAIRLNAYWLNRVLEYLSSLSDLKSQATLLNWGHRTVSLSEEGSDKVFQAMIDFYKQVDSIVEKDTSTQREKKNVYVLSSLLFNPKRLADSKKPR